MSIYGQEYGYNKKIIYNNKDYLQNIDSLISFGSN